MKRSLRPTIIGVLTLSLMFGGVSVLAENVKALEYQNIITPEFILNEGISITVSSTNIAIDNLAPGQIAESNVVDITVTTNNPYGYTLTSTVGNATYNNSNLTNAADGGVFTSLAYGDEVADSASLEADKWGYAFKENGVAAWSAFTGLPMYDNDTDVAVLKDSDTFSAAGGDIINFKIAAHANTTKASGTYNNVVNFSATTKSPPPVYYMHEVSTWESRISNTGESLIATDARDGSKYWVTREADGKIWMTQNLDFEITGDELTSELTNLTVMSNGTTNLGYADGYTQANGIIKWKPEATAVTSGRTVIASTTTGNVSNAVTGWTNDYYNPYSAEGGDVYVYTSTTTSADTIYTSLTDCIDGGHTADLCKHYHRGNYYNWTAAIASNNSNVTELNTQYNTAPNSICPANWRLPIGRSSSTASEDTMEFGKLLYNSGINTSVSSTSYATDGFNKIRVSPLFFVRGGYVSSTSLGGSGTYGYYWSSSVGSSSYAYYLNFNSSNVDPAYNSGRRYGRSVRCVAQ